MLKAKLVHHIDEWPGFVALSGLTKSEQLVSPWYDWTAWHRARCPRDLTPFRRTSELTLSKLPALEGQSDADYARDILESLDVLDPNERVLGVDRVLDTDVEGRPKQSKRARRPYAFGTLEAILKHRACCQAIAAMYELCSERSVARSTRLTKSTDKGGFPDGLSHRFIQRTYAASIGGARSARDLPSRQSSASLLDCRAAKRVSPFFEMKFGWDASKARNNAAKHGVTFEEAATVFSDPLVRYELENRNGEERILATGMSTRPRILFVVCVERDDDTYRIVSARKATKHERKSYQEGN